MPNNVTNVVTFSGDDVTVEALLKTICAGLNSKGEQTYIDFNKILPIPKGLNITAGTKIELMAETFIKKAGNDTSKIKGIMKENFEVLLDLKAEEIELLKKYITNFVNTGCIHWYDWCIKYWGTKWNAYSQSRDRHTLRFCTAWDAPLPIIKKLSTQFPSIQISIEFADENIGNNCGRCIFENGQLTDEYTPFGDEAIGFATNLIDVEY